MPRRCLIIAALTAIAAVLPAHPAELLPKPRVVADGSDGIHTLNIAYAPAAVIVALDPRLPITKLIPAKLIPGLCQYKYRVTTASAECQAFVDQSLGFYYSYVWMEAARSAETALRHDPNCAYAWFLLSRAIDKWGKGDANKPLAKAKELMPKAGECEQALIQSKLQEKGMWPGVGPDDRKRKAAATLDELLVLDGDDEEAWFARAQINGGNAGVVFYKALLKINPLNPGANHELVHFYEGYKRPALGWPYAEAYIASSPGIPHALHMQAHLAMRIGRWNNTTDLSARAFEIERDYDRSMKVKPSEDHQYFHHLEILLRSLIHDGRFAQARQLEEEALDEGFRGIDWPILRFQLHLADRDWAGAEKIVAEVRKTDKSLASYLSAALYLDKGDTRRAAAEVDVLRQFQQKRKHDRRLDQRLCEVQGRLLCQQGSSEAGVKLLQRCVDKTKDDYSSHAWGHGAYYMEQWGIGALEAGDAGAAEEAFLEALAHDAASVRGALGMAALCGRLGRSDEARNFGKIAARCWAKADSGNFERLRTEMTAKASRILSDTTGSTTSAR